MWLILRAPELNNPSSVPGRKGTVRLLWSQGDANLHNDTHPHGGGRARKGALPAKPAGSQLQALCIALKDSPLQSQHPPNLVTCKHQPSSHAKKPLLLSNYLCPSPPRCSRVILSSGTHRPPAWRPLPSPRRPPPAKAEEWGRSLKTVNTRSYPNM